MNRAATAVLALPLVLAGCHVQGKNPAHSDENVMINADGSGRVAFNFPFAKGEVKLPASMMNKGNVDIGGVKLMPGSTMTGFNLNGGGDGAVVEMSFNAPAAPDAVRSYYVDQFKQKGVEAALAGDTVTGKTREGSAFAIKVFPDGSGSQGLVTIQDRH